MRFLYVQDVHLTSRQPTSRSDFYQKTQIAKLEKMFNVARVKKVDFILIGGDLVDKHDADINFLAEVLYTFLANKDIKVKTLLGNHDCYGYNLDSAHTGLLGVFEKLRLVEFFNNNEIENIKGIPYTSKLPSKFQFLDKNIKGKKILLVHNLLLPEASYPFDYMPIEQFQTDSDLVLISHWHHPFHKKVGNTNFVNIGCFGRLKSDERDIVPSVAIIDSDGQFEIIEIGESGDKSFKSEVLLQDDSVNKFVAELPKVEFSFDTVYSVLASLKLDQAIKEECARRLDEAEKSLI